MVDEGSNLSPFGVDRLEQRLGHAGRA
jgi:hypothetical protein